MGAVSESQTQTFKVGEVYTNMATMLMKISLLASVLYTCHAHLCLISPPQRGSMTGLNAKGAADCLLTTGPCGGRDHPSPPVGLGEGEKFVMTWQKNLDHFNSAKPGYFAVSIGNSTQNMTEIHRTADSSSFPSLSLISANVTIPREHTGHKILQVKYVTNNPSAPAVFYQCSDVNIIPGRPGPPPGK